MRRGSYATVEDVSEIDLLSTGGIEAAVLSLGMGASPEGANGGDFAVGYDMF